MNPGNLVIRNVSIEGERGLDLRIEDGIIVEIGRALHAPLPLLDGGGGALIPGLHDHHIHLFALAAHSRTVAVGPDRARGPTEFAILLQSAVVDKRGVGSCGWVPRQRRRAARSRCARSDSV